ncbi:MAG TPA: EAL domain-containing protein [Nostocaceae cyanobacterium]|nr:EAL domain-containing protein [Nostocaceae cyanobacterium]
MMLLIFSVFTCLCLQLIFWLIAYLQKRKIHFHCAQYTRADVVIQPQNPVIEQALALQKSALESTSDGVLIVDNLGKIVFFNQKLLEMWCISDNFLQSGDYKQALKVIIQQVENPRYYLDKLRKLNQNQDTVIDEAIALKDGRMFKQHYQPQKIGEKIVVRIWSFRDITNQKVKLTTNYSDDYHDWLTNLPNRVLFHRKITEAIKEISQNGQFAIIFLDLDHFHKINNTLGHKIGDQLLKMVANRLQQCLQDGDILARWGGDEFTILLSQTQDNQEITLLQKRILAQFKQSFVIDNHQLHISSSIGIAIYPQHGRDTDTLIKNADTALYQAKLKGRNNCQIYHNHINLQASESLILENSLHSALEKNQLKVYYQPQVNSSTGEITKMEALLRWNHPELGIISPAKFIPIAEETGLIIPISEWVLKTACLQNKIWQDELNLPNLSIAVNLSAKHLQEPDLVNIIKQVLAETKLESCYLELEITESVAMQDVEFTRKILSKIQELGVSISIDDFGTGYSSLSYLKDFPIQALKIDKSFVRDLSQGNSLRTITTAIIDLARGLNLKVIAEGVETEEQLNVLRILQCEMMQGYLFSQPLPVEDATNILKSFPNEQN